MTPSGEPVMVASHSKSIASWRCRAWNRTRQLSAPGSMTSSEITAGMVFQGASRTAT